VSRATFIETAGPSWLRGGRYEWSDPDAPESAVEELPAEVGTLPALAR
jgi:hypothetical protein